MPKQRAVHGEVTQSQRPEWGPLLSAVGQYGVVDFMWMYEIELRDGRRVHAYKHIDTRRYVHLDADVTAYAYLEGSRYRPVDLHVWLDRVLPRCRSPYDPE